MRDDGKHAVTEYEVVEEFDFLSHLRLKLRTGRTHQIRAHLFHINHPVFGDPDYSGRKKNWGEGGKKYSNKIQQLLSLIDRQALHAKNLGFIHPNTKSFLRFESSIPEDFHNVLNKL